MRFTLWALALSFVAVAFSGCHWFKSSTIEMPHRSNQNPTVNLKSTQQLIKQNSDKEKLLQLVKLMTQADQIFREVWRVTTTEKKGSAKSAFGKVQRAALFVAEGNLATKNFFSCDRYSIKKLETSQEQNVLNVEFYEDCQKGHSKHIATWTLKSKNSGRLELIPGNLSEVLGLKASLFSKTIICDLNWNDRGILQFLSCPNWEQDFEQNLVQFSKFEYSLGGKKVAAVKAKILKELQAIRSIEVTIPLEGKILVTETELLDPNEESLSASQEGVVTSDGSPTYGDPTAKAPEGGRGVVNPDLLQRGVRPGAAVEESTLSEEEEYALYEKEMRRRGYLPVYNSKGHPVLDRDGKQVWEQPKSRDSLLFVPEVPEVPEASEPAETQEKPGSEEPSSTPPGSQSKQTGENE